MDADKIGVEDDALRKELKRRLGDVNAIMIDEK